MKTLKASVKLLTVAIITFSVMAFSVNHKSPLRTKYRSEDCSQWQKSVSHYIQMRWCTDEYGEVSHQFFNAYTMEVHFWYKFECTDGRVYTGNTTLKSGETSDKADMMKSKPSMWYITKKQRQLNGVWTDF